MYIEPNLTDSCVAIFWNLICELFLKIIRSYVDKLNFFYYADNLKVSTIIIFFLKIVNSFRQQKSWSFSDHNAKIF